MATEVKQMDKAVIERAVQQIIEAIGEDPKREGLIGTPRRIADMYEEIFAGLKEDPRELLEVGFDDEDHHELVIVKDIPFYSMCDGTPVHHDARGQETRQQSRHLRYARDLPRGRPDTGGVLLHHRRKEVLRTPGAKSLKRGDGG